MFAVLRLQPFTPEREGRPFVRARGMVPGLKAGAARGHLVIEPERAGKDDGTIAGTI